MSAPLIRLNAASFGYGRTPVVAGVDAEIKAGEFVALVGPNGAGKTTLLKGMLGLLPPLEGSIHLEAGKRFAYVPQVDETSPHWPLSVRQAVGLALTARRPFGRLLPEERAAVEEALSRTGLAPVAGRALREVSGGQRQKALLAQALAQRPDMLLLDEPTRGLDVAAEAEFLRLLAETRASGTAQIFVTHTLAIPMNHADRILLLSAGRVTATTPDELSKTDLLQKIYGIPFVQHERDGRRWVWPKA